MGYADGYYYGQTRFIINTDAMSAGDTVRVRSMTDSNKVWNKNVTATGTPLVFDVPCKDYYKICTVQDISDVPTEIGGVYKDGNYGFSYYINVLDKTTLGGIQGILNAHQEGSLLDIGDEVSIIHGGSPWIMQVGDIDTTNHAVHFVSKVLYASATNHYDYTVSNLRTAMQGFYVDIDSNDKQYIKQVTRQIGYNAKYYDDYVWCVGSIEVGINGGVVTQHKFPIFLTKENRVRTLNGVSTIWWTADYSGSGQAQYAVGIDGGLITDPYTNSRGVLPCFTLKADS